MQSSLRLRRLAGILVAAALWAGCTSAQPTATPAAAPEATAPAAPATQGTPAPATQGTPAPATQGTPAPAAPAPAATATPAPAAAAPAAPQPVAAAPAPSQAPAPAQPQGPAPAPTAATPSPGPAGAPAATETGSVAAQPAAGTPAAHTTVAPATASGAAAPARAPAPASAGAPATWPMTIRDDEGRTVTIPARPQRILSLAPSNTEILFALGLAEAVVGVDTFSDYPEAARELPRVGDLWNPNYEAMIALQPDLVLAIGGSQKVWQKLEELGVPVVVVQPQTLTEVIASIRQVGQITGAVAEAEAVARDMEERLAEVQRRIGYVTYRPRVFWEVWHDPLMSAGPGSFFDDMIRLAGGVNLAGDAASAWPEVSAEAIIAQDPEVILTTSQEWASDLRAGKYPAWSNTTAVRQGRIYVLEDNLVSRPGPRMIEGLEQVAKALMPLLYAP